jgi:hypothetical protein
MLLASAGGGSIRHRNMGQGSLLSLTSGFKFAQHSEDRKVASAIDEETKTSCAATNSVPASFEALIQDGFIILDEVVNVGKLERIFRQLRVSHADYFIESYMDQADQILKVGDKRYVFNPKLTGEFCDPEIYANPGVLEVVRYALGDDAILESFGIIISLSGSKTQHIHRDGGPLYASSLASFLPPFALTVLCP